MNLTDYINKHWDDTVRLERNGNERLVGLPYEYYVPSVKGMFQEMYYWDTFFSAKGLFISGRENLVKSAADDMFYLIDKFGYMPNGSHRGLLGRSQPPFLSEMVKDLYSVFNDRVWLYNAYRILKVEYNFWMTKRITSVGLNQYGFDSDEPNSYADMIRDRLKGLDFGTMSDNEIVKNSMADAESGWDFNPRCQLHQTEYVETDLNSILFGFEKNMEYFAKELKNGEEDVWHNRAENRQEKIQKMLYTEEGFYDYNFITGQHSDVFSVASFFPMWAKAATKEQAVATVKKINLIEYDFGVVACEKKDYGVTYQWSYPNAWAPLQYIMVFALDNYGYKKEALRIAKKYVTSMENIYEQTGALWEKYNGVNGTTEVVNEYKMPEMLGWTAGVYLALRKYIEDNE